jgi:AcrR family transcriptional regulator
MAEGLMRDGICDAATSVLAAVGFTPLTMERVAEAAGVSKGTLYNYFQDKDALILEVIERAFAGLMEAVEHVLTGPGDPGWRLTQAVRLILTGIEERRALGKALCSSELSPPLDASLRARQVRVRKHFAAVFRQARDEGRLRLEGVEPEVLARALAMVIDGVIDERMLYPADCPAVEQDVLSIEALGLRLWLKEDC